MSARLLAMVGAASAVLASCNHPQPGIRTEIVNVPVPVPCLPADSIPNEPAQVADQLTGNAASDLVIVAASALELRAWGITMHSALKACAQGSE
jgi:hypothetical protein